VSNTPAKYDVEYKWLREETRNGTSEGWLEKVRETLSALLRRVGKADDSEGSVDNHVRLEGMSRLGLVLQSLGTLLLLVMLMPKWDVPIISCFVAVVAGEIIIINSLCHHGCDIRGERTK